MRTKLLHSAILDLPPSCMEIIPKSPEHFVIGTYHLKENESPSAHQACLREGSLIVCRLTADAIQIIQTFQVPFAVLDLRFSPHKPDCFAVAASTGAVHLFSFDSKNDPPITQITIFNVAPSPDTLVLSLEWAPLSPSLLAVTISDGSVVIVDVDDPTAKSSLSHTHSLEAWVVAWSQIPGNAALYTGGDDSTICCHHVNEKSYPGKMFDVPSVGGIFVRDAKVHGAGVTSILPLRVDRCSGDILLTGSYDEFVRVLHLVPGSTGAKVIAEKRLNGGVWQLRDLRLRGDSVSAEEGGSYFSILASCMHAGCKVLKIHRSADEDWTVEIVAAFEEHESMNYASDARMEPKGQALEGMSFVSTSFYDKKLCVWRLENP
ncbi:MAG: hypothetical protein Q9181_007218 [Wetmoreana brouardii]